MNGSLSRQHGQAVVEALLMLPLLAGRGSMQAHPTWDRTQLSRRRSLLERSLHPSLA